MNYKQSIQWLECLKNQIGQPQHQELWHFEQAIDEIVALIEPLAKPHGKLIDCESESFPIAFRHELTDYAKGWNACLRSVLSLPTVIEAEVGE